MYSSNTHFFYITVEVVNACYFTTQLSRTSYANPNYRLVHTEDHEAGSLCRYLRLILVPLLLKTQYE